MVFRFVPDLPDSGATATISSPCIENMLRDSFPNFPYRFLCVPEDNFQHVLTFLLKYISREYDATFSETPKTRFIGIGSSVFAVNSLRCG